MERGVISICFADLRCLAREVPAYLATETFSAAPPSLRAGVKDELGLAGDDTIDLLRSFAQTYEVEVGSFDFTGCLNPEPVLSGPVALLAVLVAGALLPKLLASALCWPVGLRLARNS